MKRYLLAIFIFAFSLISTTSWAAKTYDWTGVVSSDWSNPGNWLVGGATTTTVPGNASNDVAEIGVNAFTGQQPTLSSAGTLQIGQLVIDNNGGTPVTLTISNSAGILSATANGGSTITNSTFTIAGPGAFSTTKLAVTSSTITINTSFSVTNTTNTAVTFTSGTCNFTTTNSSTLSIGGGITINSAANGVLGLPTTTLSTGKILLNSNTLTVNSPLTCGLITLTGTLNVNAAVSCGVITLTGTLNVYAPLTTSGALAIDASDNVSSFTGGTITALSLAMTGGTLTLGDQLTLTTSSAPALKFSGSSGSVTATITGSSPAAISIPNMTAGNNSITVATITASIGVPVTTPGDITFSSSGKMTTSAAISCNQVTTGSGSTITSGGTITAAGFSTGSANTITFNAPLNIGTGALSFANGNTVTSASGAAITAGSLAITSSSTTPTSITLNDKLNLSGALTYGSATATVTLNASGNTIGSITTTGNGAISFNGSGSTTVSGALTLTQAFAFTVGSGNTMTFGSIVLPLGTSLSNPTQIANNGTTTCLGALTLAKFANVTNTGSFNLGPLSAIYLNDATATVTNTSPGVFTLLSDATGSATIAPITLGATFSGTGTYAVQRFITGGSGKRGYRLLSSPVFASAAGGNNVYSINYVAASSFITGTTATTGGGPGIDKAGNPTLYLFRENLTPSQFSFTSGNFRGVGDMGSPGSLTNINYSIDSDTGNPYNIPVGNGFLFFFRGDRNASGQTITTETVTSYVPTNTTLTATGTFNTGTITVADWFTPSTTNLSFTTISTPSPGNGAIRGYNLVGNPYPATINWEKYNRNATVANSSIYGSGSLPSTIYQFNSTTKQYATYTQNATVSSVADTTTTVFTGAGNSSDGMVSNMIASGQGFFVVANSASQTLTFRESAKTTTQASSTNLGEVFAATPPSTGAAINAAMRVKLVMDSINTDAVVLKLSPGNNPLFDINDSIDLGGDGALVSLSSLSADSVGLTINQLPLPKTSPLISKLAVSAVSSGNYTLKMDDLENLPDIYSVWLKDNLQQDSIDFKANNTYNFTIDNSNPASYGANRFQLIFSQSPALALHLLNFTASKAPGPVMQSQIAWVVENESNYTTFTVQRSTDGANFSAIGSLQSNSSGNYAFTDAAPILGTNYYRLQLIDINNNVSYSQVITLQYADLANNGLAGTVSVYPNPAQSDITIVINAAGGAGGYNIAISNNNGAVIKQINAAAPTSKQDVSSLSPGVYYIVMTDKGTNAVVAKSKFVKL